jgi:hypothetical protein
MWEIRAPYRRFATGCKKGRDPPQRRVLWRVRPIWAGHLKNGKPVRNRRYDREAGVILIPAPGIPILQSTFQLPNWRFPNWNREFHSRDDDSQTGIADSTSETSITKLESGVPFPNCRLRG